MSGVLAKFQQSDLLAWLASEGRVFYASDADQDDLVTGQTSFANTTPTFLLHVPTGTTAMPLMMSLTQAGSVAAGAIDVIMEIDNATRYSSGGTAETVLAARTTGAQTNLCSLYSGATAAAGYGVRTGFWRQGADVSPGADAAYPGTPVLWSPVAGLDYLVGPAAWAVYTFAAGTGPTWAWTFKWAEFPTEWLT